MNRQEYLNQIQNKLQGCDAEFIAEITRDLNEHFEQGIQNGKTEQEISETLGDISDKKINTPAILIIGDVVNMYEEIYNYQGD